ncbi:anti-sigma factor [Chitinophaga oryzae]|uniref:Anti-sigma factor n=1 Tax=Chitinophaga oryzae TaxID=2725414 RepID=A0AAE7D905_9BACT|nr:anti-sigma factor [Chitinophaga oryzae]QJB33360.1 anti-sigma factor [Chitinophaga oryzae]QJB39878.1 anti-sigma factor [Chitinophaga oryzae]
MDVQRYISSGILESYVFGLLPEAEHNEVETIVAQYPQVKAAVQELQLDRERFVQLYAMAPPAGIKDRLLDIIREEETPAGHALLPEELRTPAAANGSRETPVKRLNGNSRKSGTERVWKYIAAAIILLFLGSVILNFFFFSRSTDYKSRYQSLVAAKEKLDAEKESQSLTASREMEKELDMLKDPAFKWIKLEGFGANAGQIVTVCWNPVSHAVFLIAQSLPLPPAGKQYQLWAIHNKKLVDAGVFHGGAQVTQKIQPMKPAEAAEGFAITLENEGGSTQPTMDQLQLSAKIQK